tara:strand:+ start:825 stop:1700 length:876 start_codon:yes stop_codon:yes gene_type:complete
LPVVPLLVLCLTAGCQLGDDDDSSGSEGSASVQPLACGATELALPANWATELTAAGFTKCAAPFGVIIGAVEAVPDAYVATAARIVAELIDPDEDGQANDPAVLAYLAQGREVWLPMPANEQLWTGGVEEQLGAALGAYGIMIPEWWMGSFSSSGPDEHARAVMVEEIIHAFTQFGYGLAYPEVFGVNDWSSVVGRETQAAQCSWWQHPENSCPGVPSQGGDCSDPSCDVTEFYHQVLVLRAGMTPGWFGIGFPQDRTALESLLSDEIKAAMDNPAHHQLREPLGFDYGSP